MHTVLGFAPSLVLHPYRTIRERQVLEMSCIFTLLLPSSPSLWGFGLMPEISLKEQFIPKPNMHKFHFPFVLFINVDSFGVRCLVLEISAVDISAFSLM